MALFESEFWRSPSDSLAPVLWVFALVLVLAVISYIARKLLQRIANQAGKTRTFWDDALVNAASKPLTLIIWAVGLAWIGELMYAKTESIVFGYVDEFRHLSLLVLLLWFVVKFISEAEKGLVAQDAHQSQFDQTTILAMGKLLRSAVFITGAMLLLQAMGYNISSLLAVGSVGGIAVSFASRDLLANFFGGLMVYMDRPFSVGDWIRSPDRNIEGTVEHIGWRTTCIRTFDKRPLYVPNSTFTNIAVENPSRMSNRRIYETIGIRYADAAAMNAIVADVKAMLLAHTAIDASQTLIVNFNKYADSSLEFFVYTFTKTTNWVEFHEVKHEVLMQIGQIIAQHGAQIAFPTRTVEMAHMPTP